MSAVATVSAARGLARRAFGLALVAFLLSLALFLSAGAMRLWPRIAGQHLPLSLIWPFARPLLAVALELSFLVTPPMALGLAASSRAARAAPSTWLGSLLASAALTACFGAFGFALSALLDGGSSTPGELASELVANARQSCIESQPPAEVSVPLVGFSWSCAAERAPRLHGKAPFGKNTELSAGAIVLSDDLRRVKLDDISLAFSTPLAPVQLRVKHASLRGLPPWGRSRRMRFGLRAALFLLSAWLGAFGLAELTARARWLRPWVAALCGVGVAAPAWLAFSWLERQDPGPIVTLVLPLTVILAVLLEASAIFGGAWVRQRWLARSATPGIPRNPQ